MPDTKTCDRILIVEDDSTLAEIYGQALTRSGYRVQAVRDGRAMRRAMEMIPFDLVLLDIGLPGEDGFVLTRFLREHTELGVIIVTGRCDPIDRVVGIEIGADDYITKPVFPRELVARVRAVLRRTKRAAGEEPSPVGRHAHASNGSASLLFFERFVFDQAKRQLRREDGTTVRLTTGEFNLLAALIGRPGEPLTREQLMEIVHGRGWSPDDRAIDQHVANLRRKLESNPEQPEIIVSVRGVGYVFAARTSLPVG